MTYCVKNYKTKKALVADVKSGMKVEVYEPGPFPCQKDGTVYLEGPHFPEPHRWYAKAVVENGFVVKVS